MENDIDIQARRANNADLWDHLWKQEGDESWRKEALNRVYTRVERLTPMRTSVIDVGGGIGLLADRIHDTRDCQIAVWDHSVEALRHASLKGIKTRVVDLIEEQYEFDDETVVCTEVLEHLPALARHYLLNQAAREGQGKALFSVPNNRLGPDEEPQHTIKFTAMSFKEELAAHFKHVRVEVLGPYLLGVCGFPKAFTMSVCFPARDEADDIEATLASFRGVADQMVIGIDPRSNDTTEEIARRYADEVFILEDPQGVDGDVPEKGVHFAHIRNQCMERCEGDWIFMTEAHERLLSGEDVLLALDKAMVPGAKVGYVLRTGQGQRWGFPWLSVNHPDFRYKRATHNILTYPEGTGAVRLPQVQTLHERSIDRSKERATQREAQNRRTLMEDWLNDKNENSLFYLGQEWRIHDPVRSVKYLTKFLATSNNGAARYQARLMLAKLHMRAGEVAETRAVLHAATADDWSRTEHWIWLGDIAFEAKQFDQALCFYRYAGTTVNEPPFTLWWIDLSLYGYLAAQRLAMVYSEIGRGEDALHWAEKVLELLPDDAPAWAFEEARGNIAHLKEALETDL